MNSRKTETAYVCNNCGQDFSKWHGRCPDCGAWDAITEFRQTKIASEKHARTGATANPVELSSCESEQSGRIQSSFPEIDRVLGGGLVSGALILIGGDPGIGKSTLLMQLCAAWAGQSRKVIYVSGEESAEQIFLRGSRLEINKSAITLLTETSVEAICASLAHIKPDIVIIDSIQTMFSENLESSPGSVSQVRESASLLMRHAKENNTVIILIGHVTKEGAIAGPRVLEHMVDTVLYFEGDSNYQYRIVRSVKNRYGPSGEIAIFEMTDRGLREITNASQFFLLNRDVPQIGTSIVPVLEGSRILVVEMQALVNKSHFGLPQRVASGINPKKLSLLLAVIERFGGLLTGDSDIFFNVVGGLTVSEPAIDLGITAAIMSSYKNRPLRRDLAFIGELGLGGEIRPVNNMELRLKELFRMGFKECVVTKPARQADWTNCNPGMKLIKCAKIGEVQDYIF
jgi:DNA repair protein RadA/Sms